MTFKKGEQMSKTENAILADSLRKIATSLTAIADVLDAPAKGMAKKGKEYAELRGMENVLRQFVKLEFEKGKVVGGDGSIVKSSSCWMRTTSMPW